MERGGEGAAEEVLYEIRHHARGSLSRSPFQQQLRKSQRGSFLSYLSVQGISQLKEKWSGYKRPNTLKKRMSIFVSPVGEHVAIAAENQIIILHKDDDYMEPCGVFVSNDGSTVFTSGAWSEPQAILGIIDDASNIYFIKSNGEEITRRTKSHLNLSSPIIGLIVHDDLNSRKSCLCGFCIFTIDGLLHHVEVTQEPRACTYPVPTLTNELTENRQLPLNVSCLDFHPSLSLVVLVADARVSETTSDYSGCYSLYLLRVTPKLELEVMFHSPELQGSFSSSNGYNGPITIPKVMISPKGEYVVTLDLTGCIDIFKLDGEAHTISFLSLAGTGRKNYLKDIIDACWWADHILALARRNGSVTMYDVHSGMELLKNEPILCMPVMERAKNLQGHIFLLEAFLSSSSSVSSHRKPIYMLDMDHVHDNINHQDSDRLSWSLMSLSTRSVSEMYTVLISNRKYDAALDFATRYEMDMDEIFKAQWLQSNQGIQEIDMFLSKIKDESFVLSECLNKEGPTEDVLKALLSYGLRITDQYSFSVSGDSNCSLFWEYRMARLQLLQYRDRLETFMGINMGRFSALGYSKFRVASLSTIAISLAEGGKIGALNLLFKRHPYSLSLNMLDILSAVPETVPVQSYSQLLPGSSPPSNVALRDGDWVECEQMISFIEKLPNVCDKSCQMKTEIILKHSVGFLWPSVAELSMWYKNRARDMDSLSGQLDNCLSLLEFSCCKGFTELQKFFEDISYLYQLVYSDGCDNDFSLTVSLWEQLSDYEKFKMMLKGVKHDIVVQRLQEKAIPFMQSRFCFEPKYSDREGVQGENYLIKWLKETAADNDLDVCLAVIENGCGDSPIVGLFKDEAQIIETALECIYLCTLTDQWNTMALILSKLPQKTLREKSMTGGKDFGSRYMIGGSGTSRFSSLSSRLAKSETQSDSSILLEGDSMRQNCQGHVDYFHSNVTANNLDKRIKIAEGHVEVGRLLAYYQVPKPVSFFLDAHLDEKNVKQLIRLILSKFGRKQPSRSDNEWANMWRDMQCFQEKVFPFLDVEYMLVEFCRGLLKAGKFSLARNYLKGIGPISLAIEKAENLVIQAAREYFYSASSLACAEIWKAKECLSLLPNSKSVQAEADMIDALTIRLPNLGVTLLPMQFRQIRNPMEIINLVISSQSGAYLNVDELIGIAKLLGLSSHDDIAAVEEAVARQAAVAGDLQLASDLCLALAKKGHGSIWDLCAAIARGPHLENMDAGSRKQLLGFAINHCDEESIGELLHAWKDIDMCGQYEQLMRMTGTNPPNFSVQGSSIVSLPVHSHQDIFDLWESSEPANGSLGESGIHDRVHRDVKNVLSLVARELSAEGGSNWDALLSDNWKALEFAALELPWLLDLSRKEEFTQKSSHGAKAASFKFCISFRMQALVAILYWFAGNNIAPKDELIASLANSIFEPPVTEEDDVLGCSLLLNLGDAVHGVDVIEEQVKRRDVYKEIHSIMIIGMTYSSLQSSLIKCATPNERRKLLLHKFREKHASFSSGDVDQMDQAQSTFWREWKTKLEEQKRLADQTRALEQILSGIEATRFLSGDADYIKSAVFAFIDSIKLEKRYILKEAVKLADTYGLPRTEVLLRFFGCALVSKHWGNDDILAEISEYREDIVACAKGVINMISTVVYPEIEGHNKQRLSYIYSILSACYLRLKKIEDATTLLHQDQRHKHMLELHQFCKILEQECLKVSNILGLNFKNIAGLNDLNFEHFNEEICKNIHESSVEALADMVRTLSAVYDDSQTKSLMSWQAVYKKYVLGLLSCLQSASKVASIPVNPDELQAFVREIEQKHDSCERYVRALSEEDKSYIIGRYLTLSVSLTFPTSPPDESGWKDCVILVLDFWIKLATDSQCTLSSEELEKPAHSSSRCLKVFKRLVMENEISLFQGWRTISDYAQHDITDGLSINISGFCKAMIFSGCGFHAVAEVYSQESPSSKSSMSDGNHLLNLYMNLVDASLSDLGRGSAKRWTLHHLLSTLSKLEGKHMEDLGIVRHKVWRKLCLFSNNMEIESHIRLYTLELMQSVMGRNLKSLSAELISEVKPWEAWDESCWRETNMTAEQVAVSSSITGSLVALKSTQLAALISPDIKITPEDLLTLDSAVSCFLHLSETASSIENLDVLQAILNEWEELFSARIQKENANELPEELSNWSSDDWDEGWENLPEELISKEIKQGGHVSVCPLHVCWLEIIKRLVGLLKFDVVIKLLDQSLSKANGLLLEEDETLRLFQLAVGIDCFMTLKILLLLPYEVPQAKCLDVIETKLKTEGIASASSGGGWELLTLVLSSGMLQDISMDPSHCKLFSYICNLVGHLAQICQEDLRRCRSGGGGPSQKESLLFGRVLLPCFVSELVKAGHYLLAGFIVSQWMHTPASLGLVDIVEASLRKYLEGQALQAKLGAEGVSVPAEMDSFGSLSYSVSRLRHRLAILLQSALTALQTHVMR